MSSRWVVFFAVPEEARPFLTLLGKRGHGLAPLSPPVAGAQGWRAGEGDVWVSGMGARRAGILAEAMLSNQKVDQVFTCGFAGGLDPSIPTGTVVYDADAGFPVRFPRIPPLRQGRFHLAGSVAASASAKARLWQQTGAQAVDMESQAIRSLCRSRGVPSATVRVISDAAGEDLPLDFGALMTPDQRIDFVRLAGALLRSPRRIPALIRFSKSLSRSAGNLAQVLDGLTLEPGVHPSSLETTVVSADGADDADGQGLEPR